MIRRKAFTLVEILIAMFLMAVVILSMFTLNQTANKSSMDAYYEMLCFSLAREPIEVFRGFGYDGVSLICENHNLFDRFPVGGEEEYFDIQPDPILYPAEADNFKRSIVLEKGKTGSGINYIKIRVSVAPKGSSKAETWLRKDVVSLESVIVERP